MRCIKVYGLKNRPTESKLLKDLTSEFGKEQADYLYNNILWAPDTNSDISFLKWYENTDYRYLNYKNEPPLIAVKDWLKYMNKYNEAYRTFNTNKFRATVLETLDMNEGFSYYVMNTLFKEKNINPNQLLDLDNVNVKNVLNKAFGLFMDDLNETQSVINSKRLASLIDEVNNNKILFYNSFNNYLNSKIKLSFNIDKVFADELETVQDKVFKDSAFNKDSIEFDTKDGAPDAIKLLLASLPQVKNGKSVPNSLGLPKLVNYTETFNFIQDKLVDLPGDINILISELSKYTSIKPELEILIDYINFGKKEYTFPSDEDTKIRETRLRTQFVNTFDKYKLQFKIHIIDENGNIKSTDGNLDKIQDVVLQGWQNNLEEMISENPKHFDNIEALKYASKTEILQKIGITLSNPEGVDNDLIQKIVDYGISSETSARDIFKPKEGEGVRSTLLKLADIHLASSPEIVDLQQFNFEGKLIYSITLNSHITTLAKELSYYAGNREQLETRFPYLFSNNYSQGSIFLNKILNGAKVKVGIFNGFTSEVSKSDAKASKELKGKDLILQRVVSILKEKEYPLIRTADRGQEYFIKLIEDNKTDETANELLVSSIDSAKRYYKRHLSAEIETMMQDSTDVIYFEDNNKEFRAFGYKDKNGVSHKLSMDKLTSSSDPDAYVDTFIDNMIEYLIRNETEYFKENGVFGDSNYYMDGLIQEYGSEEAVISLYALNYHIANIEQTKALIGDLAFFKNADEIFKRMAMINSTKDTLRVDDEMNTLINSISHRFEEANGFKGDYNNNKITTITLNDEISKFSEDFSKQEVDTLREVFKDNKQYFDVYDREINEADGSAFVTIDEYRRIGIRSSEWSMADEKLYNMLAEGNIDYNSADLHRWAMKKYQYSGRLLNEDLSNINVPAGRKFAFVPLIPGLYKKGSTLEKLNNEMLSNGIGMAFMTSAAKYGHKSDSNNKAYHDIYKEYDFSTNHDILDYKYLGNQLKVHNKPKKEISGTQRNKIIKGNFYENGKPINDEVGAIINELDNLQEIKIKTAFEDLKSTYGIDKDSNELNSDEIELFVDSLVRKGIKQGFNSNDLLALQYLKTFPLFDIIKNKQVVESLLNSSLKNNVIDNKRKGDMMAQTSDVGFEINVDNNLADRANKHNLDFYKYAKKKDGSLDTTRMIPMQIMVPLPKHLVDYVISKYSSKSVMTEAALAAFNADIAEDIKNFEETGEETELTKIRTYSGFRIPTQEMASLEVAQVKEFFMPHMVGMVVVPKAIVVKTGSDFDIDKLNLYIPHYKIKSENLNKISKKILKGIPNKEIGQLLIEEGVNIEHESLYKKYFMELVLEQPLSEIVGEKSRALKQEMQALMANEKSDDLKLVYTKHNDKPNSSLSKEQLENKILEKEIELMLHPSNHTRLLAPLTEGIIKQIVTDLRRDMNKDKNQSELFEVFTGRKNIEKFISFLSGLRGVSQVAIHITNHASAQQVGLEMKSLHNYFGLPEDWIPFGNITNQSGQYISEVLSSLITAYVDVAKDDYILDINAVNETANTILMMTRWGLKPKTIFYFINQPIIKEFLKRDTINRAVTTNKNTGKLTENDIIRNTLNSFDIPMDLSSLIYITERDIDRGDTTEDKRKAHGMYSNFTITELAKSIKDFANGKKADRDVQLKSLDLFLEYRRQSNYVQDMITSVSHDTQRFKNVSSLKSQIRSKDKVTKAGFFKNYDKLYNGFVKEQYESKKNFFNIIRPLFLSHSTVFEPNIDALKELYVENISGESNKIRVSNNIENALVSFILGSDTSHGIDHNKYFNELFKGDNSIPKVMNKIKAFYKKAGHQNAFIENMLPLINYNKQGYDSMRIKDRKPTPEQVERMIVGFESIMRPGFDEAISKAINLKVAGLGKKILIYSMIQSGIDNSPFSLMKALPHNLYFKMVETSMFNVYSGKTKLDIERFTGFNRLGEFTGIGEFIEHNAGLLFKKYNNVPFDVKYKFEDKIFSILAQDRNGKSYAFLQKGANNYRQYGTLPIPDINKYQNKEFVLNNKDIYSEENMLRCKNNK